MATLEDKMEDNQPTLKENIAKLISEYNELREDKVRLLGRIDSLTKEVADYKEAMRELMIVSTSMKQQSDSFLQKCVDAAL